MEKSILLSKTALFAFLVVIASCVSFSMAARAPTTTAELESEPALVMVKKAKTCSADEDCKKISACNGRFGWQMKCVDDKCKCVREPPQLESTHHVSALNVVSEKKRETCTTVKDCVNWSCPVQYGVHLRCIKDTCKCVHDD